MFAEDNDVELHVVALRSNLQHDRIHVVPNSRSVTGLGRYRALEKRAKAVFDTLDAPVVHANAAHIIGPGFAAETRAIVQVNDTEVCQWTPSLENARLYGLRRNIALGWRRTRERAVVRRSSVVVCNSSHTSRQVAECYRLDKDRVRRIYKAVPLEPFLDAGRNSRRQVADPKLRLLFVGSNWRRKGLDVLIKAIGILAQSADDLDVELTVVGHPVAQSEQIPFTTLVSRLGVKDRVRFLGSVDRDNLPTLMVEHDVLVLPSREEALGLAAVEGLAAGLRVIAANVGGLPEIIRDCESGTLVSNCDDPQNLADAIISVAKSRSQVADAELHRYVERFGMQRLESDLRNLYSEVFECNQHR